MRNQKTKVGKLIEMKESERINHELFSYEVCSVIRGSSAHALGLTKVVLFQLTREGSLEGVILKYYFLCRFQCVQMPNQVLESISIIDTPGILTAAKRKLSRGETECLLSLHTCDC